MACLCQAQVRMAHVDQAVREMYGAVHMQLLGSCCQLDKMLLACLVMEVNAQGADLAGCLLALYLSLILSQTARCSLRGLPEDVCTS